MLIIHLQTIWHAVKDVSLWIAASAIGWIGGTIYSIYAETQAPQGWFEHPAVVSAVVAGLFLLLSKGYDHLRDWRKEKGEEEDEHLTNTERMQELTQQGWQAYLNEIKLLHQEQIKFFQSQLLNVEIDSYRDRQIKHKAFDEIQRLHGRIRILEVFIAKCDNKDEELPPFEFKYQDQILAGVEDAVDDYKRSLRNNIRAVSGAPEEKRG